MTDFIINCDICDTIEEDGIHKYVLKNVDMVSLAKHVLEDTYLDKFFSDKNILNMFTARIGVEKLLQVFSIEDVCEHITWDYIRKYFMDHIDVADILNHIGWELVSNHFSDYIHNKNVDEESINISNSVLEKINECKGEN
jgi:hypothetical protein